MNSQTYNSIRACFAQMAILSNDIPELKSALEPGLSKLSDLLLESENKVIIENRLMISKKDIKRLAAAGCNLSFITSQHPELYHPLETANTLISNIIIESRLKVKTKKKN